MQVGCKIKRGGFGASPPAGRWFAAGSWWEAVAVGHCFVGRSMVRTFTAFSITEASTGTKHPLLITGDPAQEPAGDLRCTRATSPVALSQPFAGTSTAADQQGAGSEPIYHQKKAVRTRRRGQGLQPGGRLAFKHPGNPQGDFSPKPGAHGKGQLRRASG